MNEESLGELTPRAEHKDTIDGEGLGMYGENLTSKETIKAFREGVPLSFRMDVISIYTLAV